MKLFLPIILSLLCSFHYASEETYAEGKLSEEAEIELLINSTKNSLEQLEKVKKLLISFKKQEKICIDSPENGEALFTLSKAALQLRDSIHEASLEPYFRSSFLKELDSISKAAKNHTIPPILQ